ncbi:MAG TPA: hypothetical protein VJW73_16595 [Gemmatimonadaceae bacterium]|nr:hypothetical protein [Gemmatimonadaceae bacterium]
MNKFSLVFCLVAAATVAACSDSTSPHQLTGPGPVLRSGGSVNSGGGGTSGLDSSLVSGGGGGGGGGGGTSNVSCGTLTNIQTQNNIVVYTTRTGIGVTGGAYNCSSHNESFEVDFIDQNPDPYCQVVLPHFVAAKNTSPGVTQYWSATSTLVNCQGQLHTFTLILWDTRTGQQLDTTTASVFL